MADNYPVRNLIGQIGRVIIVAIIIVFFYKSDQSEATRNSSKTLEKMKDENAKVDVVADGFASVETCGPTSKFVLGEYVVYCFGPYAPYYHGNVELVAALMFEEQKWPSFYICLDGVDECLPAAPLCIEQGADWCYLGTYVP